jgi:hypothetical protein
MNNKQRLETWGMFNHIAQKNAAPLIDKPHICNLVVKKTSHY